MTRKVVYILCRPFIRKCPKWYFVLIPFVLALAFTAYLYRDQSFNLIRDADMIRIPDNIVDVQQEVPPNGAELERNKVRVPAMLIPIPRNRNKVRAAAIQNENQSQEDLENQIDKPPQNEKVEVNVSKPVLVAPIDKNESKPVANDGNAPPHQNSSNIPVPSALNHTTEQKVAESKIATEQNVPNKTATANVAPSNSTNANNSSATIDGNTKIEEKGVLNETHTNSTDLKKEPEKLLANVTTSVNKTQIASNKTINVLNSPLIKPPISNHQAVNLPNIIDDGTGSSSNQSETLKKAGNNAQ